jgi:hypothetical protein
MLHADPHYKTMARDVFIDFEGVKSISRAIGRDGP